MAEKMPSKGRRGRDNWRRDLLTLGAILALMGGVQALPADTSLKELRAAGRIAVCMPSNLPPFVAAGGQSGPDVALVQELARRMDLRLVIAVNGAMGRDFNPRNWRLSRAQCQMVVGGVLASANVRAFMETIELPVRLGWQLTGIETLADLQGRKLGVFAGLAGLDRLKVSASLRAQGVAVEVFANAEAALAAYRSGQVAAVLSDSLSAEKFESAHQSAHFVEGFENYPLALALWRGDLTLLKEVEGHIADMRDEGLLAQIYAGL